MLDKLSWRVLVVIPAYVLVPWLPLRGPFDSSDIIPTLGGLAALVVLLGKLRSLKSAAFPWACLVMLGLLMTLSHGVQHGFLTDPSVVARTLGRMGLFALVGAALYLGRSDTNHRGVLYCFAGVALFEALFGAGAALVGYSGPYGLGVVDYPAGHFPAEGWGRAQGTFGGVVQADELFVNRANFYSAYLMIALFVVLKAFAGNFKAQLVGVVVMMAGILASGSRMSLLAALIGLSVYGLVRKGGLTWLIAAAGTSLLALAVPSVRSRFTSGLSDRLTLWEQAISVVQTSPWLGVGDGRYLQVLKTLPEFTDPILQTPHHSILFAAASYGVLVAGCLALLYGGLVWRGVRARTTEPLLIALTAAFVCHDMTNNLFFVPEVALAFWIAWALLVPNVDEAHD